jgi:hypothetical protein
LRACQSTGSTAFIGPVMLQSSKDHARAIPVEESTEFRVPWGRFRRGYGQAPGMWLKFYAAGRLEISQGDTRADRGSEAIALRRRG